MVRVTVLKFARSLAAAFVMKKYSDQRFWETRVYRLDKNRLDMMTTRSPLWAPVTTRYATRTCRWSVSQTSFVFLTSLVSRVERVCIGFISSKAEVVALFLYQPSGSLEPFVSTEEH